MKHFANPPVGLLFLLHSGALGMEQIRDRLNSNANMLRNSTTKGSDEPPVEPLVDEAFQMAGDADRVAAILHKLAEGQV